MYKDRVFNTTKKRNLCLLANIVINTVLRYKLTTTTTKNKKTGNIKTSDNRIKTIINVWRISNCSSRAFVRSI